MVEHGLHWSIGEGNVIRVYTDVWVTNIPFDNKVWTMACAGEGEEMRMEHLMNENRVRDEEKLATLFSEK